MTEVIKLHKKTCAVAIAESNITLGSENQDTATVPKFFLVINLSRFNHFVQCTAILQLDGNDTVVQKYWLALFILLIMHENLGIDTLQKYGQLLASHITIMH